MHRLNYVFMMLFFSAFLLANDQLNFSVSGAKQRKMPLLLSTIGDTKELHSVAEYIKKDLAFTGQFKITFQVLPKPPGKKELYDFAALGYFLGVFINQKQDGAFEWRIYDTMKADMVAGKEYKKRGTVIRGWAHNIADAVWPVLTGAESSFSSKIAYCKEQKNLNGKRIKHICIADYDGSYEQVLVDTPTVSVAPRWNGDQNHPKLFYTEHTNANARLMVVDMNKKKHTACDFDGINMSPAFSPDDNAGKAVVFCSSQGDGRCQLFHYSQGKLRRITHNYGNNISPTFSDNNDLLYFCSDYQTGNPQIYAYCLSSKKLTRITNGGFCASPTYSQKQKKLAYTKMTHGYMQLFVYDEKTWKHEQLTQDASNKQGCSWSPCGNYILIVGINGGSSNLIRYAVATKQQTIVSDSKSNCSYPAWSPQFVTFPDIRS